jgi:hypothetical protein
VVLAGAFAGLASASPSTDTTNVKFTGLNPTKTVLSAKSIAANASLPVIVAGGSTTVPTGTTTVRLQVTVKGSKAGTLTFYPTGNPGGSSGYFLAWTAGGSASGQILENVGQKDEVTFGNTSSGAAIVTAVITGYSSGVTAADVSPAGAQLGQVLMADGLANGVNWESITSNVISGDGGTAGQVLTNTGTGSAWQDVHNLPNYQWIRSTPDNLPANSEAFGTVTCPLGTDVLSGGAQAPFSGLGVDINSSYPLPDLSGWAVMMNNSTATARTFQVYAVCATVS